MEVDFILLLSQLRHIGQVAEATLYAAPAREELTIPTGLSPEFRPDDFLRRAKHHQVRGVHGNVSCILGHNSKAGRDCGHVFVAEPGAVSYTHLTLPTICSV